MATVTINILCPNGRRVNVKASPNSTIYQLIEEACLKQHLDPSLHDLKHGRNTLDVSASFRFSGVPNNAKLEMVVRSTARSSVAEVTIALQIESGERKQKNFTPESSLYEVVTSFEDEFGKLLNREDRLTPVIVYLRDEVIGVESLQFTSLKSLGLLGGKAALRLVYREVDQAVLDKISSDISLQQKKMAKYINKPVQVEEKGAEVDESQEMERREEPMDTSHKETPDSISPAVTPQSTDTTAAGTEKPPAVAAQLSSVGPGEINPPVDACRRAEPLTQPLPPAPTASNQSILVQPVQNILPPPQFAEFKFPEETKGQNLYRNELSAVEPSDYQPCERELVVFNMSSYNTLPAQEASTEEPSEDFFEVTKEDLQVMIRHLREQVSQDENAPLMTAAMRQARFEQSFDKYSSAIIRFHFPDKMVLQAKFRPRETIYSLMKFVKSHLKDESMPFHLYCTPPKQILKDKATTLIQAHLVPMSIVYVGFDEEHDEYLKQETLEQCESRVMADDIVRTSLPQPELKAVTKVPKSMATSSSGAAASSSAKSGSSGSSKVPKWYKGTGK